MCWPEQYCLGEFMVPQQQVSLKGPTEQLNKQVEVEPLRSLPSQSSVVHYPVAQHIFQLHNAYYLLRSNFSEVTLFLRKGDRKTMKN